MIREGDPTEQILEAIDQDVDISILVLAANPGAGRPGPDHHHDGQDHGGVPDSRHHRARRIDRRGN